MFAELILNLAGNYLVQLRYFGQHLFFIPHNLWWASAESNRLSRCVKAMQKPFHVMPTTLVDDAGIEPATVTMSM